MVQDRLHNGLIWAAIASLLLLSWTAQEAAAQAAIDNEVMITVADNGVCVGVESQLAMFVETVQAANVSNVLVLALDKQAYDFCAQHNLPAVLVPLEARTLHGSLLDLLVPDSVKGRKHNEVLGSQKFLLARRIVERGYHVFLVDTDIVVIQNPFPFLVRDTDIECMSDGWTPETEHGAFYTEGDEGWFPHGRYSFVSLNTGTVYLRATNRTSRVLELVCQRLTTENVWDQHVFTEAVLKPSYKDYNGTGATLRILDEHKFANSKFLYKTLRHVNNKHEYADTPRPVLLHFNAHAGKTSKPRRMRAAINHYLMGDSLEFMEQGEGSWD
ncbi:hypothetical protein WJX72_002163 [[Myrmecia] bisecta]|uniref:Nucleotide-diphospho-sugar transferase domain-containing protein n=1 Tax=[Myrmecia] bisecta TaxID=41462 RepID=A0AAW1P5W4_9CHLO